MKKVLDKKEAKALFERMNKADKEGSLFSILRLIESRITVAEFMDFYSKLKNEESVEVSSNVEFLIKSGLDKWENEELSNKEVLLTIKGFNEVKEAEEFCNWYSGQGEQDSSIWFECRKDEGSLNTDSMECESINKLGPNHVEMFVKV